MQMRPAAPWELHQIQCSPISMCCVTKHYQEADRVHHIPFAPLQCQPWLLAGLRSSEPHILAKANGQSAAVSPAAVCPSVSKHARGSLGKTLSHQPSPAHGLNSREIRAAPSTEELFAEDAAITPERNRPRR